MKRCSGGHETSIVTCKLRPSLVKYYCNRLVSCHLCNVIKMAVIPAEAGIQKRRSNQKYWIPAFAGMTLVVFYFLSHQTLDT